MNWNSIRAEAMTLAKSFLLTVASAAALAGLNWLTGHIPAAVQFLSTGGVAYASLKHFA